MFNLKIVLLLTIVSSSLVVDCNGDGDIYGAWRNAFNTKFDQIVELIDQQRQSVVADETRRSPVEDNYDDAQCYAQMMVLMRAFNASETWALKVFDSWGKLPSGVFSGNLMEQGDFDQCLSIVEEEKFEPQYCLGMVSQQVPQRDAQDEPSVDQLTTRAMHRSAKAFGNSPRMAPPNLDGSPKVGLTTGICVPNTCSPEMIKKIVKMVAAQLQIKDVEYDVIDNTCQGNDPKKFSSGDIATFSVLLFLTFLTIISTAYDVICERQQRNKIDVLTAFSFHTNLSKIFVTKRSKSVDVLECLNGIRVLSTIWVVYGHSFVMMIGTPLYNIMYLPTWAGEWFAMTLLLAPYSVDTFLFLSGLLITWQLLKHLNNTDGKINIPLLYVHRYLRLTPVLALGLFVMMTVLTKYNNGPLWNVFLDRSNKECYKSWWAALLYIQNYYNSPNICFLHSWYLSVDFQLFVVSPLLVYLLYRLGHKFVPVLGVGVLASMGAIIGAMWRYNLRVKYMDFKNDIGKVMELTYFPTHTRMAPWLIGMIFAYILFNTKNKRVYFTKIHAAICWVVMLTIFGMCAWYTHIIQQIDHQNTAIESGVYLALTRVMWPIGVALLVWICIRGYGGPVNTFLSAPSWLPFCRLSYAIYIVHMPVIIVLTASSRRSFYFTNETMVLRFCGNLAASFAVCIIAALLCESPILKIEKFIFGNARKPVQRTEPPADVSANTSQQDLLRRAE